MSAKVSVITVIFNLYRANRIKEFTQNLESVRKQTYGNIEHIVVDGNSNDGTVDYVKRFADKGWIKFISEPDSGIYDAMNKGAMLAEGDYIAFLNSDDYWHDPRGVAASVEALEKDNAAFSFAKSYTLLKDFPVQQCHTSIGSFFMRMPFCHQSMFVRRDIFMKLGMFDMDNYRSAADFNFIVRLCMEGYTGVYVPLNFTAYRHGGFSATDMDISQQECIRTFHQVYSKLYPQFTEEDARKLYYEKSIPRPLFEIIRSRVCPLINYCIGELRVKPESTDEMICFDDYDYSYPVSIDELEPDTEWKFKEYTYKFAGIPVFSKLELNTGFVIRIFGIPVIRGKKIK